MGQKCGSAVRAGLSLTCAASVPPAPPVSFFMQIPGRTPPVPHPPPAHILTPAGGPTDGRPPRPPAGVAMTRPTVTAAVLLTSAAALLGLPLRAADWPQWMGPNRDGVWPETGIVDQFPPGGPKELWRVPIGGGFAGPAV